MNTIPTHFSRLTSAAALVAALALSSPVFAASNDADAASRSLATRGIIQVDSAGRYVERGTFRIQVREKLGRPDAVLGDNTWLYERRNVTGSDAQGTLIVRFEKGRVADLALATPVVVAALRQDPRKALNGELIASK